MLAKDGEYGWLSRLQIRYRRAVRKDKDIKNDFHSNDSPNDNLESRFWKSSWPQRFVYLNQPGP